MLRVLSMLFFIIILFVGPLIAYIFYILTLQKTLTRCSQQNRVMNPGQVWLMLIPVFNLIWHFRLIKAVSTSLNREYTSRNIPIEPEPGKIIGYTMCFLSMAQILPFLLNIIGAVIHTIGSESRPIGGIRHVSVIQTMTPPLMLIIGIVLLVFWIIYWTHISSLSNKIAMPAKE